MTSKIIMREAKRRFMYEDFELHKELMILKQEYDILMRGQKNERR
jgi:hypothetical protein